MCKKCATIKVLLFQYIFGLLRHFRASVQIFFCIRNQKLTCFLYICAHIRYENVQDLRIWLVNFEKCTRKV